jgi:hypothetical protein
MEDDRKAEDHDGHRPRSPIDRRRHNRYRSVVSGDAE